jgi:hypothetical protein
MQSVTVYAVWAPYNGSSDAVNALAPVLPVVRVTALTLHDLLTKLVDLGPLAARPPTS